MANTDYDFYGGQAGGLGAALFGGLGFGPAGYSQYLGTSAYAPNASSLYPLSARNFLSQYLPELGGYVPQGFSSAYSQFRQNPGDVGAFLSPYTQQADVQQAVQREELRGLGQMVQGGEGTVSLQDYVGQQFGQEGSLIQQLYAPFGQQAASQDILNLLQGGTSALGNLVSKRFFDNREVTQAQRYALGAQLLGGAGGLVDVGGGQGFNPFSYLNLTDEYQIGSPSVTGTERLEFGGGLLSTQDLDITQQIGQYFQGALQQGADLNFGGRGGYILTSGLADRADLGAGQAVSQSASPLGRWIDQWYSGLAGSGFAPGLANILQPQV